MLGHHLIGSISCTDLELLTDSDKLAEAVKKACLNGNLTIVDEHFHMFENPTAITYSFILSESHFVVHTWPEHKKILFDVFCCNASTDTKRAIELFASYINGRIESLNRIDV